MRVLVTGADGFVGRHLVRRLVERGDEVGAAVAPGGAGGGPSGVARIPFELTDDRSIGAALEFAPEAVIHLAAVASTREAREDPGRAWNVNAGGTARLAETMAARRGDGGDPLLLVISTGEVYGALAGAPAPRRERDEPRPISSYAASKVGGEMAALEVWRRTGLRTIIVRPFTHTGPGQDRRFVLPAFVERLKQAKASGAREVSTGNLDPVRDLLDVRDVIEAYLALLERGVPGETYNVARGEGCSLRALFVRLAEIVGVRAEPRPSAELIRGIDVPHLVGDAAKLRQATGWSPAITLDATLRGLVDAQAD